MKAKDCILGGMITLNLFLLVLLAAVVVSQTESVAQAGAATDRAGFVRKCTLKYADDREGLVVIDTLTNKMGFYVHTEGRKEILKAGPSIDLALAFKHPK